MMGEWPLVGRNEALRQLRQSLLEGSGRGVVLAGATGVGKSRLAAEGMSLAERAGWLTVRITATRASATIPLGAFAPVLPASRHSEPGAVDDRADLIRRCASALVERAGRQGLVLFVDDAHLLDDTSATLVHQVAATRSAKVLATVRCGEPAPDSIVALWKEGLAERMEVTSLSLGAVGDVLSAALGGAIDDGAVAELAHRSKGNMLFLRELVMGALDTAALREEEGIWRLTEELHPTERLVELVEARLASLQPEERALMEVVAFGEPLGPVELSSVADLGVAERLERKGLLNSRMEGRRLAIRLAHPLYGEVLRTRVPRLTARSIARALAEAVEATGARRREDTLRVATWRLLGGGARPGLMLEAAATARWRYDFGLAERLARAAADAGAGFDAELLAAQLAALQGRSAEAGAELAALATKATDDEQRGRVAVTRLENRLIYAGTIDEGLTIVEGAEAELGSTPWRDEIAARSVALVLAREGPRRAALVAEPLLQRTTGSALVWAALTGSYSMARMGRIDSALAAAERGHDAHGTLTTPMDWYPWMHLFNRGDALAYAGRFHEAEELAEARYRAGVAEHSIEEQALFAWLQAKMVADRGHVDDAVRRARIAAGLFRQLGRPQFVDYCLVYLVWALSTGGRYAEAVEVLRVRDELGLEPNFYMGVDPLTARGWTEVAGGNARSASEMFREAADTGERIGDLVGAAVALHSMARIGHAKEVVARLEKLAAAVAGELAPARAAHAQALAANDPRQLEDVSARFDAMGADLLAAEASADAAVAWRRHRDQRNATAAERRAEWLATPCKGANTPALQITETRARLTPAEWEAAQLAAAGRSNKEIADKLILSVRTVENRLYRIYTKLGVTGRAELSAALETIQSTRD